MKTAILLQFTGEIEALGFMLIVEIEQKTKIRFIFLFWNIEFDIYINAINSDYDSEELIFTGWLLK